MHFELCHSSRKQARYKYIYQNTSLFKGFFYFIGIKKMGSFIFGKHVFWGID